MTSSSLSSARSSFFKRKGSSGKSLSVVMDTPPTEARFLGGDEGVNLSGLEETQSRGRGRPARPGARLRFPGLRVEPKAPADPRQGTVRLDHGFGTLGRPDQELPSHLEVPALLTDGAQEQ